MTPVRHIKAHAFSNSITHHFKIANRKTACYFKIANRKYCRKGSMNKICKAHEEITQFAYSINLIRYNQLRALADQFRSAVIGTTYTPSGRWYAALLSPHITQRILGGMPPGSLAISSRILNSDAAAASI